MSVGYFPQALSDLPCLVLMRSSAPVLILIRDPLEAVLLHYNCD